MGQNGVGLLDGLRVLDLSIWRPGPYTTHLLADLGAEVIKVERPGGDPFRAYPELFDWLNANKLSVVLDLDEPADRERFLALAAEADVVIESIEGGVAPRMTIGYEPVRAVNLSVIYCSVSGMGRTGPLADAPARDVNVHAWAGALAPDGGMPASSALPVAELAGGMSGAFAICAAVVHRDRTGEGQHIDLALADVLSTWTGAATAHTPSDARARVIPGYGTFGCADVQFVTIGVIDGTRAWTSLCSVLGLEDLAQLGFAERVARGAELQAAVADRVRQHPRDRLVEQLLALGVAAAPVLDRQGMNGLDHFWARSVLNGDRDHPTSGHPVRFVSNPARVGGHGPGLDEHHHAAFSPRPAPHTDE
jgi:crotonobetainyl-CoA:carnitine CoA-transferase CaiB-like acyl-CoA transferase